VNEVDRGAVLVGGQHAGGDRRDQHQERPDQRVDDELRRRPHPVARAPDADQEVERDQHQVEEGDEQDQVLGAERAEHGALGEAEEEVEERGRSHSRAADHTSEAVNSTVVSTTAPR
jgi:hypothetical protein